MTKKSSFKNIEPHNFLKFQKVSQNFYSGADLAFQFEYFNAAGVLIIHSAIALADSLTIKKSSKKCSGDNHFDIIQLLKDVTPPHKNKNIAIDNLKYLIEHKNIVSYSGDIYHKKDVEKLFKYFHRFETWANFIE